MMDSEMMRALLAVLLRGQDIAQSTPTQTPDHYLQQAQYWLESSYRNYPHPVENLDR